MIFCKYKVISTNKLNANIANQKLSYLQLFMHDYTKKIVNKSSDDVSKLINLEYRIIHNWVDLHPGEHIMFETCATIDDFRRNPGKIEVNSIKETGFSGYDKDFDPIVNYKINFTPEIKQIQLNWLSILPTLAGENNYNGWTTHLENLDTPTLGKIALYFDSIYKALRTSEDISDFFHDLTIDNIDSKLNKIEIRISDYKIKGILKSGTQHIDTKCIIVDADNTLWKGTIDEVGINGISLTNEHLEFQQKLLEAKNKGILLALSSKNNLDDIKAALSGDKMPINLDDFATIKASFVQKKSINIGEIINDLGFSSSQIIFLDDNPKEQLEVGLSNQKIYIPKGSNIKEFSKIINSLTTKELTTEDKERTKYYQTEKNRRELLSITPNLIEYFNKLQINISSQQVNLDNKDLIRRVSQLTQRTNQFNMTLQRYSEEDITNMLSNKTHRIFLLNQSDCYGNNGNVATIIIKDGNQWEIDNFCLSCRALNLNVEDAFINLIKREMELNNVSKLTGKFTPLYKTESLDIRNNMAKNVYSKLGFTEKENNYWEIDASNINEIPDWIAITPPVTP
jgi:FkbH-like protein